MLAEATSTGWDEDRQQSGTRSDWKAERLGPMIPDTLRTTWKDVQAVVAQTCGIPSSLTAASDADGTQLREDYRRFVMSSVEPVAALIAAAVEAEVRFDFASPHAHDIIGRATAFNKLTDAGVSVDAPGPHVPALLAALEREELAVRLVQAHRRGTDRQIAEARDALEAARTRHAEAVERLAGLA